MPSAYNLKQKMLGIALADEMLRNPPMRRVPGTNRAERFRYPLEHIKKITKLNHADLGGILNAIIEEQKKKDVSEPNITYKSL